MMDFSAYGYSEVLGKFHQHKQANIFCGREEYGVSSLAFDPQQDLLWSATYGVSFLLPGFEVGTCCNSQAL